MTQANITTEDASAGNKTIKIIKIVGQLDESNVDEQVQNIYKVLEESSQSLNLIFDLENLEYMNSKSIGYLTDIYGKITENNGQMAIAKAKPNILDILQVVGLTQLIKTFNSIEEAKDYVSQELTNANLDISASAANGNPTPAQAEASSEEATASTPTAEQPAPPTNDAPTPAAPAETPAPAAPQAQTTAVPEPAATPANPAPETSTPNQPQPVVTPATTPEQPTQSTTETPGTPAAPAETPAPAAQNQIADDPLQGTTAPAANNAASESPAPSQANPASQEKTDGSSNTSA